MAHASLLAILLMSAGAGQAPAYDLVLRGGKVVDGTGNPWYYGDVAIAKDRIALVGSVPAGSGKREIDAKGLVVAPGFVDIHSHSEYSILEDGRVESKIRQGVTTEVFGESDSPGPAVGKMDPVRIRVGRKTVRPATLGEYFDQTEKAGVSVNVASFVGLGNVWQCVMGTSHERPTPAQLEEMKKLVAEAMEQGASGLSCCLAQTPDLLSTTDDLVELCKVVARYKGIFVAHVRGEGTGVFDAIREVIEVGRRAGVQVEILHIKIADQSCWGRMNEIVKLVDDARNTGVNVQANVYPYTRGHNDLATIIPPWAHEGGTQKMLARLKDPAERVKLKRDIREGLPGWYDHFTAVGGDWSKMLISDRNSYGGLTMDRILAARVKDKSPPPDLLDEMFDLLIEQGGNMGTVYAHHTEKDMNLAMIQPWCGIGSDGSAAALDGPTHKGHPHPRSFGTFPRILGVYVRERGLLKLEDAVRKMSSQNALKLGLTDRGLIRPGQYADVVLFDPERVADRATYEVPFAYPDGINVVVVNGQIVLENGVRTEARPGRALRHKS